MEKLVRTETIDLKDPTIQFDNRHGCYTQVKGRFGIVVAHTEKHLRVVLIYTYNNIGF